MTEDNLQLLKRAGESGDHSPTPSSLQSDIQNGSMTLYSYTLANKSKK